MRVHAIGAVLFSKLWLTVKSLVSKGVLTGVRTSIDEEDKNDETENVRPFLTSKFSQEKSLFYTLN